MQPFLKAVAERLYNEYGNRITDYVFVFPSHRAGMFFERYLSELIDGPLVAPQRTTMSELMRSYSSLEVADRTYQLFLLYHCYNTVLTAQGRECESFDRFLYWGEVVLADYNDVDKWLVDSHQLFSNIIDIKELELDKSYLTENQRRVIETFWETFLGDFRVGSKEKPTVMERFLLSWQLLSPLYDLFSTRLREEGLGYEGMLFRNVVEQAEKGQLERRGENYIFVGFNALTLSEERFLSYLSKGGEADFYWDYDFPRLPQMPENPAAEYAEHNRTKFPSRFTVDYIYAQEQEIHTFALSSTIGQVRQASAILREIAHEAEARGEEPDAHSILTAVVMPDETLVNPLLRYIPRQFQSINITMGYQLSQTAVAGFIRKVIDMQLSALRHRKFYHLTMLPVLNHPIVCNLFPDDSSAMLTDIRQLNQSFISSQPFAEGHLLNGLFSIVETVSGIHDYIDQLLELCMPLSTPDEEVEDEGGEPDESSLFVQRVETETIIRYREVVKELRELIERFGMVMEPASYFRLFRSLVDNLSVPFVGEPLQGLQLMGVLETRSLDFDNLIITNMNEGAMPKVSFANSFIPQTLRAGFGMSVLRHQEAIYAYHFYRMIARARRVFFIYDTRSDSLAASREPSRYIQQLTLLYNQPVIHHDVHPPLRAARVPSIIVQKDASIMHSINQYLEGGRKSFSASTFRNLIDCPLRFYFKEVKGLREEESIREEIASDTFGTIFHYVMEQLYSSGLGMQGRLSAITSDRLDELISKRDLIRKYIREGFYSAFYKDKNLPKELPANLRLIALMIERYVIKSLYADKEKTPFVLLATEQKVSGLFPIDAHRQVNLFGVIDRIDEAGSTIRLIDYKTGKSKLSFGHLDQLFLPSPNRLTHLFQVVFYGLLLECSGSQCSQIIPSWKYREPQFEVHIHSLRNLSDPATGVSMKKGAKLLLAPEDLYASIREEFTDRLRSVILDLFNPDIPFVQAQHPKQCEYCPYRHICQR